MEIIAVERHDDGSRAGNRDQKSMRAVKEIVDRRAGDAEILTGNCW